MRRFLFLAALNLAAWVYPAQAQWQLQQSHTTSSLRGIHALGNGVAWASGTEGTVLRTTDDGATWQPCAIPPAAEHLDFRGIQAFDAKTAIVMSSGKGDLSRLYKTTDACQTWRLVFTNPDKEGFWDAMKFPGQSPGPHPHLGFILGDPVAFPTKDEKGGNTTTAFPIFTTNDAGEHFDRRFIRGNEADPNTQGAFAASNTSLFNDLSRLYFVTGGVGGPKLYVDIFNMPPDARQEPIITESRTYLDSRPLPMAKGRSAGAFSILFEISQRSIDHLERGVLPVLVGIAVGGDYEKPGSITGTATFTEDGGKTWTAATTPPNGYRSAVGCLIKIPFKRNWITVGPNGTDLSTDDGRTWRPLRPTAPNADPEEDQHWNALSLPFVVGPKGRIGKLRNGAISK